MSIGVTVLAALGPALGKALYEVGKEVVAKPLMGPAAEPVRAWVRRGYDARAKGNKVRRAVEAAAEASGLTEWEDWGDYPLRAALDRLAGKGHGQLRESTAAAALAMRDEDPVQVPDALLRALDVDERHRPDLARFLWALRNALADADEDYRALVTLAQQDDVRLMLRRLVSAVIDVDGQSVIAVLPVTPPEREIEEAYLRILVTNELRYLPLKGRWVQSPKGGIDIQLQNVYIALNTRPEVEIGRRGPELGVSSRERQEPRSALRVAMGRRLLLLLGDPGSGKTTFVEHLALCLAGERWQPGTGWPKNLVSHDAAWEGPAPLPVRIRLREFAADEECLPTDTDILGRAKHLLAYVEKHLRDDRWSQHLPSHVLDLFERGQALLVLDGLDEVVDPRRRRQVAEAIGDLVGRRYRDLWVLVTCRVAQYPLDASGRCAANWALPDFHHATLADFTPQQMDDFADRWFAEIYSSPERQRVRRGKAKRLKAAIRDRPDLREIAPRPILLTQMALVYDIKGELPGTRVELYQDCANLLLWEWDRIKAELAGRRETADQFIRGLGVPGLRRLHLEQTLDHAVFEVHEEQGAASAGPVEIPSATLESHLASRFTSAGLERRRAEEKAACFVSEFLGRRNGLIVPAGEESFQTPHRTFHEFMAARYLQSLSRFHREAPERVRGDYDLWHEVVVLAVGLAGLDRAWHAVDTLDHLCPETYPHTEAEFRELILAGEAVDEVGALTVRGVERGPAVEERIMCFLQRAMQDTDADGQPNQPPLVPVPTRYAAAETLDRLGWLPRDLDVFVEIAGLRSQGPIYVGRYPVTNHQFARFMAADGYENREYWGGEESDAWRWRIENHNVEWRGEGPVSEPEYWDHPRFGKIRRGYPVVGVSWYEAMAYCGWLTEKLRIAGCTLEVWRSGEPETLSPEPEALVVRLPTEEEWIAAAGGEMEDRYPWGLDWDESRANTSEGGIGGTSPVAMYPSGRSRDARSGELIGVWNMGGNVWQWMASEGDSKPLRGGSWGHSWRFARVAGRDGGDPGFSYDVIGFRVVVSPGGSGC